MTPIYKKTLEIAQTKIERCDSTELIYRPRLGTGGNFADVFFWDTAFTAMWAKYHLDILPVETSLDNLYRLQDDDGHINRQYFPTGKPKWSKEHPISSAPPVLAWAELELFGQIGDTSRLKRVYPHLAKHHAYIIDTYQCDDGLFFSDPLGCGMDNLPRAPHGWVDDGKGIRLERHHIMCDAPRSYLDMRLNDETLRWNRQGRYIDLSAQMAFNALCLARIAELTGADADSEEYRSQHATIGEAINERCWWDKKAMYVDLGYDTQVPRLHIGGWWPLIARIVPADRIERYVSNLTNEETFGRMVPVPSMAACEPEYQARGGYWRGASWPPATYMVLTGMKHNGMEQLARQLAEKFYRAAQAAFEEHGTIFENYAPDDLKPGHPAQPDFCGWSGLATVAMEREFLGG
ncbi:MAG: hypothetical protein GF398_21860 [Chitinivibrionales bacterium]|nr:hypothetical protein [Chitinivibrionales bacterium]